MGGLLTRRTMVQRKAGRNSIMQRGKLSRHMKRVVVDHFYQRWKLLKNVRHMARAKQTLAGLCWLELTRRQGGHTSPLLRPVCGCRDGRRSSGEDKGGAHVCRRRLQSKP